MGLTVPSLRELVLDDDQEFAVVVDHRVENLVASHSLMTRSLDVVALGERELVLVLELLHRGERDCPDHLEATASRAPPRRFADVVEVVRVSQGG